MITNIKFANEDHTQISITTEDDRVIHASLEGSTWIHELVREWLKDNTPEPYMTETELLAKRIQDYRNSFKISRQITVDSITVEVDGMIFDGDEVSQNRMSRAITGLNDEETIEWTLADNTTAEVSKQQLRTALRLAGGKQSAVWRQ